MYTSKQEWLESQAKKAKAIQTRQRKQTRDTIHRGLVGRPSNLFEECT